MTPRSDLIIQPPRDRISRRSLLLSLAGAWAATACGKSSVATNLSKSKRSPTVAIENFDAGGQSTGTVEVARVVRSDAEWRKQLDDDLTFRVTRHEGTEAPFSGKYAKNHSDGLYRCICCATALFDSRAKFESGTGWPSFWQPLSRHNVAETTDSNFGMRRTAVSCALCDAHLGHVFDDGPRPTGLRYCMNSVALRFVARA